MNMSVNRVLLIDDDRAMRDSLTQWFELAGHEVAAHGSGREALDGFDADWPGVVITDLRMPGMDGFGVLDAIVARDADMPVLMITGHGDVASAVEAMRRGAYDFLEKPFQPERMGSSVARALEKRALVLENRALRRRIERERTLEQRLIGDCTALQRLRAEIENFAGADVDVLLIGETGTGKEVVARCLHDLGRRREAPFHALDCAAIATARVERELFGESGGQASPFERADGGTLLLDEIADMPVEQQTRLLRVLESREVRRVGEPTARPFDVRVISAAGAGLEQALRDGAFRHDLYYRLNTIELTLPPLRERGDDALVLFEHFVRRAATEHERPRPAIGAADVAALRAHRWPGNVRELRHLAERFVLYGTLSVSALLANVSSERSRTLADEVAAYEKSLIEHALSRHAGELTDAARELGTPRRTLADKLQRHAIDRDRFRER